MNAININEQIAYYRKQRGLTQEDVARALGVTNQAVSKWESAQCCPDITLLPELADLFEVSVDKLLGRKPSASLGELCHMLKAHFSSLPEHSTFGQVYRIAALLHEAAATDGYKQQIPWQSRDYSTDDVADWGLSVCSEPEGCTVRKQNSICFTLSEKSTAPNNIQLHRLSQKLSRLSEPDTLKVLFALYSLTQQDFDLYVTAAEIAEAARLPVNLTENLLNSLPLTLKEEDGALMYRLDGANSYLPSILMLLCED